MYQCSYSSYYIPDLLKFECVDCEKQFILSDGYDNSNIKCPYCQSKNVDVTVLLEDADILGDLGCMAIGFHREEKERRI